MARGTSVEERNKIATQFVTDWIDSVRNVPITALDKLNFATELGLLELVIPISQMGFRGVILTAIVGKYLNKDYDPLLNFYECNPRSIFEKGIRYALQNEGIPCGKSDPLNVAKNIAKLDYDWANNRRPENAARAAVDYLRALDAAYTDTSRHNKLLFLFFRRLVDWGNYVSSQNVLIDIANVVGPWIFGEKLANFVLDCAEGGAIPQFIVGELLAHIRQYDSRFKGIEGYEESVFGTNTTSKKPADIWEVLSDGSYGRLYEVTVKHIDYNRLDDCVASLNTLGLGGGRVTFICNMPKDIEELDISGEHLQYKGTTFQFLGIKEFIVNHFGLLDSTQQKSLVGIIQQFVSQTNRAVRTKQYWAANFA